MTPKQGTLHSEWNDYSLFYYFCFLDLFPFSVRLISLWFHDVGGPSATCGSLDSEREPLSRISNRRVILNPPLPKSNEANQHASRQPTTTSNLAAGMEQEWQNTHHLNQDF